MNDILPRSQPEKRFIDKMREQLAFLDRSCQAFDQGHEEEALRIATALRVIFHQTTHSTPLLAHLGLADSQMLSCSLGDGEWKNFLRFQIRPTGDVPVRAVPMLSPAMRKVSVNQWWRHESVFVHEGKGHPRRKIILSAANKDGGTHVDKELDEYYEALCSGKFGLGITGNFTFEGPAPYPQGITQYATNSHLATLRQFGFETLESAKKFRWVG